MKLLTSLLLFSIILNPVYAGKEAVLEYSGPAFGHLGLVDVINCGDPEDKHKYYESEEAETKIAEIFGEKCRVLPNNGEDKIYAWKIGRKKKLRAGEAYLLSIEYPEDTARSMYIINRGAEVFSGLYTGKACGDAIYGYTVNNVESIDVPLSGDFETWQSVFFLHEVSGDIHVPRIGEKNVNERPNLPKDGFWVIIGISKKESDPFSAGAAVKSIKIFRLGNPEKHFQKIHFPPAGLPRRHTFARGEMGDTIVFGSWKQLKQPSINNSLDYYDQLAAGFRILGIDTFCIDLLEFGHNQGWDSADPDWYNSHRNPKQWQGILDITSRYSLNVFPYYEYAGSTGPKGLGKEKRARPLSGSNDYTHVHWSEKFNIDVTDPDALEDFKRVLDMTIVRHKNKAAFLGAWLRPRVGAIPISFADETVKRFADEVNGGDIMTEKDFRHSEKLLFKYYNWWMHKRRDFLNAVRQHLIDNGIDDAVLLYTSHSDEPGPPVLDGWQQQVVTDDVESWRQELNSGSHDTKRIGLSDYDQYIKSGRYLDNITAYKNTWAHWEWQHADPPADPHNYTSVDGINMTMPYHRFYSTSSASVMEAFRASGGLAITRHFPLNEHVLDKRKVGYFVADMNRTGPYAMLAEARAVAYGDPRYITYLSGSTFHSGAPYYMIRFNRAFLSLPALPSKRITGACKDKDIVVREIRTKSQGTYYAVVNVSFESKKSVSLRLPAKGQVTDSADGIILSKAGSAELKFDLYPGELRALLVE